MPKELIIRNMTLDLLSDYLLIGSYDGIELTGQNDMEYFNFDEESMFDEVLWDTEDETKMKVNFRVPVHEPMGNNSIWIKWVFYEEYPNLPGNVMGVCYDQLMNATFPLCPSIPNYEG